jgi:hypothetical protein
MDMFSNDIFHNAAERKHDEKRHIQINPFTPISRKIGLAEHCGSKTN